MSESTSRAQSAVVAYAKSPDAWRSIRLRDLLSEPIRNGYSPVCGHAPTGHWVLGLGALGEAGIEPSEIKPAPSDDRRVVRSELRPGDFLVSRSNTRDKVGRASIWRGEVDHCSYPDLMMRFRVSEELVDPGYLDVYLRSSAARIHFEKAASGTSGSMVKINKRALETLPVALPPLSNQRRIAQTLATWDEAIEKTGRLLLTKRASYSHILDRLMSESEGRIVAIRELAAEVSVRNRDASVGLVLSVTNRGGFELPADRFSRRIASEDLRGYKLVRRGQYAYNPSRLNVGSIGRLDKWEIGALSPMYVVFELDEGVADSDFFLHWLSSSWARGHITRSTQGSVRDSVGFPDFGAIRMRLPDLDDQRRIAGLLNMASREIDLLARLKQQYELQRRGLEQQLFAPPDTPRAAS